MLEQNLKKTRFLFYTVIFIPEKSKMECPKCGRILKSLTNFRKHVYYCKLEANIICEHCPFRSKHQWELKRHMTRRHPDGSGDKIANKRKDASDY